MHQNNVLFFSYSSKYKYYSVVTASYILTNKHLVVFEIKFFEFVIDNCNVYAYPFCMQICLIHIENQVKWLYFDWIPINMDQIRDIPSNFNHQTMINITFNLCIYLNINRTTQYISISKYAFTYLKINFSFHFFQYYSIVNHFKREKLQYPSK